MKNILSFLMIILIISSTLISCCAQDASDVLIGDVSMDNQVTVSDCTYIQRYLLKLETFDSTTMIAADTNASDTVTIVDATLIQRYIAGLITKFPAQELNQSIKTIAQNISCVQTDSTLTLTVLSDMHFDENHNYNDKKLNNIKKLGELQKQADIDFVANLGDFVVGNEDKATTVSSLKNLLSRIESKSVAPVLNVRGNHDDNGWYTFGNYGGENKESDIINNKEWCELALSNMPQNFVFDENNPYGGYGYIDHDSSKIRIFVLNSSDIPYVLDENGAYRYNSYIAHAFSDYQLDFVADALTFSDKENPNDWAALFLIHAPIDTSNHDGERFGGKDSLIRGHEYMLALISAYKNGTKFKAEGYVNNPSATYERKEDFYVSVDADYSKKGCGEVIAFFNGHTHTNNYSDEVGIKNSLSHGYTYIGTVAAETFTNYVIDREKKSISAFSYGEPTPEYNEGTVTKTPQNGSLKSGNWSVTYDQFIPSGEDISNGMSEKYPLHYMFDDNSTKIDLNTLEFDTAIEVAAPRQLTKAIMVKPFTTYIIPDDFVGDGISFYSNGARRSFVRVVDHGDYKTFTTDIRHFYVLFSLDTGFYKNYKNFFVKEMVFKGTE